MKNSATRMLFSHWDRVRGERAAPERGEIEPGAIRYALADTFILEVDPDQQGSIRLAGTRLCALFGGELRGRPFRDLWAEASRPEVQTCLDAVVAEASGVVAGALGQVEGGPLDLEMILLPLRHRGRTQARVLGAISPASVPVWIGLRSVECLELTTLRVITSRPQGDPVPALVVPDAVVAAPRRRFVLHQGGRA